MSTAARPRSTSPPTSLLAVAEVSLYGLDLDAHDPGEVARFWVGVLGWRAVAQTDGGVEVAPDHDPAFRLLVRPSG